MPGMGGCGIPPCGVIGGNIPGGVGVGMGAGGGCSGIKRGCSGGGDDDAKQPRRVAADNDDAEPADGWS